MAASRQAGFPVVKSLENFKVQAASVPLATFNYIAGLEWIRAKENLCLVGPACTESPTSWLASAPQRCRPDCAFATHRIRPGRGALPRSRR